MQGRALLRLVIFKLGLALAWGTLAHGQASAGKVQIVSYNRRSFLVPFNIPPGDVARYKQIQLWSTSNGGISWDRVAATTPDKPFFNFAAKSDGEFWFMVRTVDTKGRLFPSDDADLEPNMKVTIDTKKPTIAIEPRARRGNVASIAWDVTDESAVDLKTLMFDYQVDNSTEWVPVPIRKQSRIGVESWDAGTAEPIKVRGVVADLAGNRQVVTISLPGGGVPDDLLATPADLSESNTPPPIGSFTSEARASGSNLKRADSPAKSNANANPDTAGGYDPFSADAPERPTRNDPAPSAEVSPPILVASPKFGLQYAVDDAGPNGPAAVELFVTNDGGRNWTTRGEDTDRISPFQVDLGGEGRFGLKLVAKSAANQGDRPPTPGEVPQTVVEVDSSGPTVSLDPPRLSGNKLLITWHANDAHPTSRPVMISIRADAPDAKWQIITPSPIENTGQYSWLISARCPPKIHVRVDVRDALNNLGYAETPENSLVLVDRSKPKGRILGLDSASTRTSR